MNDYTNQKIFEEQTTDSWINFINQFSNVYQTTKVSKKEIQFNEHIDAVSILHRKGTVTIDFKLRELAKYYEWYLKDNLIFIETWGNDTKLDDPGSSIFNSTAKYWAYGWWYNNKLTEPFIFERKPFCNFIIPFLDKFQSKLAPNPGFNTEGKLIPKPLFSNFTKKIGELL